MIETNPAPERKGVPMWAQIVVWVFLLGLLTLVALGLKRTQEGSVQVGDTVPDFTFQSFDGDAAYAIRDLRGKVVVINFWASWCKPCEQEAAELEAAYRKYKDRGDVIFIGVDYVDTEPEARRYLQKFDITYPNGPDMGTKISQAFRVTGVPETYFVDRNGVLQFAQIGPFESLAAIEAVIEKILAP